MRKTIASWILGVSLVAGAGVAFADTHDVSLGGGDETVALDPVDVNETEGGELEEGGGDGQDGTLEGGQDGTLEGDEDGEDGTDGEDGKHGAAKDNHGAIVSAAAHNHDHDEACGNHGAYVSAVARTGEEPACATQGGEGDSGEDGSSVEATGDAGDKKAEAKAAPKGKSSAKSSAKGGGKGSAKGGGKGGGKRGR